jgi:GH18 family chitinase
MRWNLPLAAAGLCVALAACTDVPTSAVPGTQPPRGVAPPLAMNASSARVVGYLPEWYGGSLDSIRYDKFTHLMYAFVVPTSTGALTGVPMSGNTKLAGVVQRAHAANTKVLISIGGWNGGDDSGFRQMSASSTARATFVSNVVTFIGNYGLDGVDIDWEFPNTSAESSSYATLMADLDTALHSRGKLLTAAVPADAYYGDSIRSQVFNNVDFLFLMAYEDSPPHSPYSLAVSSLNYWRDTRGLPQSKTVLGVPFYGDSADTRQKAYRKIVAADAQAPYKDSSGGYDYNGLQTMKDKTTLSLQRASGVGIWEITQDTSLAAISLLSAIHDVMNATKVVYDDARGPGWANWSWGATVDYAATSPVHLGSKSIAVTYTAAWGGLYLHGNTGVSPSGLSKLEFYVHGGTAGGQQLALYLGDTGGSLPIVPLDSYVTGGSVAAGAWRKVSIPLSALGVTSNAITDLVIQDDAGGAQPTFYVDQIQFVP